MKPHYQTAADASTTARLEHQTLPLESLSRGEEIPLGFAADTIEQSFEATGDTTTLDLQMRLAQGHRDLLSSKETMRWQNETLYSTENNGHFGQLGQQINSRLRDPKLSGKGRMNFGSPEKYSGHLEKHRFFDGTSTAKARLNNSVAGASSLAKPTSAFQNNSLQVSKQESSELPPTL